MKRYLIKYVVIVLVMIAAGVVYSCSNKESISLADDEMSSSFESSSIEETETSFVAEKESANSPMTVCVYVCGAVNKPDVYELRADKRVIDAINAAGGFNDEADTNYLNLADVLIDGEKIYVPTKEEVEESKVPETLATVTIGSGGNSGAVGNTSQKVNINTATAEELKTLNGIGDKRAQDIINYRSTHDKFNTIEDIKLVPGIKDAVFSKICDYIEV